MVAVTRQDIEHAFAFVNADAPMVNQAYISLDTGKIYWLSELIPTDEELPDDLETSDRYLALPHKNELHLGKNLALQFAADELRERRGEVAAMFSRKGAYRRFKELLDSTGLLHKWYRFEEAALEAALQEWCAENDVQIVEAPSRPE